jgi:hypothetical protein
MQGIKWQGLAPAVVLLFVLSWLLRLLLHLGPLIGRGRPLFLALLLSQAEEKVKGVSGVCGTRSDWPAGPHLLLALGRLLLPRSL